MMCPHGYKCLECPEGENYDCDYDLSPEEINESEKLDRSIISNDKILKHRNYMRVYMRERYRNNEAVRQQKIEYYQRNKEKRQKYQNEYIKRMKKVKRNAKNNA